MPAASPSLLTVLVFSCCFYFDKALCLVRDLLCRPQNVISSAKRRRMKAGVEERKKGEKSKGERELSREERVDLRKIEVAQKYMQWFLNDTVI